MSIMTSYFDEKQRYLVREIFNPFSIVITFLVLFVSSFNVRSKHPFSCNIEFSIHESKFVDKSTPKKRLLILGCSAT
jgi:hypothetical protein